MIHINENTNMDIRIVSAVPRQLTQTDEKLAWLDTICKQYKPHIVVTPQEFFGGAVMMPHARDFRFEQLYPQLKDLNSKYGTAFVVGVQERDADNTNKTAIWFINEDGKYQGRLVKCALPRYDHISTSGFGGVTPETQIENRFKTFKLYDLNVSAIFCWEVYSNLLWTGLSLLQPDIIFSLIKFGVNAWPKVQKKAGRQTVTGFGYGSWAENCNWIDRLRFANVWQVKCPIICATNSWNLRPISMPLCGCISGIDGQADDTLWHPTKEDAYKQVPEKIIVDSINSNKIRAALENKFLYKELVGKFPPFSLAKYTMMLKINRIERRILRGKEVTTKLKSNKMKEMDLGGI